MRLLTETYVHLLTRNRKKGTSAFTRYAS